MILVFLLYALFASVFTISKTGLQYTQPLFFVGTRMLAAGILMLSYQYVFNRKEFRFKKEHFWGFVGLAAFNIYLTNACEFWGLQRLTSFKTCFIYSLSPFVAALLSYFMFKERLTSKKWLGLIVGFAGMVPIFMSESSGEETVQHLFFVSWGELAVVAAAVSSVYGWMLLRRLVKEYGYSTFMANGISMMIGGSMALVHSRIAENWDPVPVTQVVPFLECAFLLIVVSNLICYNLYGVLLRKYTATFMSFAGFSTPLFTAFFGWFFLGETVSAPFYLSAVIVFAGLALFNQEELGRGVVVKTS